MTNNKKIAIDLSFIDYFGHGEEVKVSSLTIFITEILNSITNLNKAENFILLCRFPDINFIRGEFPEYEVIAIKPFVSTLIYKISNGKKLGGKFFWKDRFYKKIVKNNSISAVWFPFANHKNFIPAEIGAVKILTVHDIVTYHSGDAKKFFDRVFSDKTNKFIVVSEYTKKDIENTLNYMDSVVIPPPITLDLSRTKKIDSITGKYILDINSYTKRKNNITLLKAFNLIKDKTVLDLVFCGGQKEPAVYNELLEFVKENHLESRVKFFYAIPEDEKNWLMLNSYIFVNPSTFEGFGRTPVDAAICKIPVISSKATSLYEATMGLVNYYENPTDSSELAEKIIEVINTPTSEDELNSISEKLVDAYSPKSVAEKYMKIFQEYL